MPSAKDTEKNKLMFFSSWEASILVIQHIDYKSTYTENRRKSCSSCAFDILMLYKMTCEEHLVVKVKTIGLANRGVNMLISK